VTKKSRSKVQAGLLVGLILVLGGCSWWEGEAPPVPRSALNYFQDGNTAFERRDYPIAVWNYQQAIDLDDRTPSFHYNLGLAHYEMGNYEAALEAFDEAVELAPEQPDTHYNLALVYYQMRNSDKANRHYNRYQALLRQQSPAAPPAAPVATPAAQGRSQAAAAAPRQSPANSAAQPPPEMINQMKQQLMQRVNSAGAGSARPAPQVTRPRPTGPPRNQVPGWE
jgi:tetratricopeptide (TPR) repeat protein